MSYHVV